MTSEAFAGVLTQKLDHSQDDLGESEDVTLKPDELDDWLQMFGEDRGD